MLEILYLPTLAVPHTHDSSFFFFFSLTANAFNIQNTQHLIPRQGRDSRGTNVSALTEYRSYAWTLAILFLFSTHELERTTITMLSNLELFRNFRTAFMQPQVQTNPNLVVRSNKYACIHVRAYVYICIKFMTCICISCQYFIALFAQYLCE